MGNTMTLRIAALYVFGALILCVYSAHVVSAFVISPSQIDLPTLVANATHAVDLVSETSLILWQTNCTLVNVTLSENQLLFTTSPYATSALETCVILVSDAEKPSVSFAFTLTVRISSTLVSNNSIAYNDTHLWIQNIGNGSGTVWFSDSARSQATVCSLDPAHTCLYMPTGMARVCADVDCNAVLFTQVFAQETTVGAAAQSVSNHRRMSWLFVGSAILALLLVSAGSSYLYLTRRNRTLLKDTR